MTTTAIDTHGLTIGYGKHKGELWTRVPRSYLQWIVNEGAKDSKIAQAELDRRGTPMPEIEVSAHAIDRASLRLTWHWKTYCNEGEGIYSWLARMGKAALEQSKEEKPQRVKFMKVVWVFKHGEQWPILVTVHPNKQNKRKTKV